MSSGKRILSAYATSLLSVVSALLTNLWLLRAVVRTVDADIFGLYAYVLQITSYLAVLQLGLDLAVARQIAEALGKQEVVQARQAYGELLRFNRIAAWICLGLSVLIASALCLGAGKEAGHSVLIGQIVLLTGLAQALGFRVRSPSAALIGSQLLAPVNIAGSVRVIASAVVAFSLLQAGLGILCIPCAEVLTQAGAWAWLERTRRRHCPWSTQVQTSRDEVLFTSMFHYGLLTLIGGVAWTIESTSDVFILKGMAGDEAVALYFLWWRFPQLTFSFCTNLAASAFPSFAESHGASPEKSALLFRKVAFVTLSLGSLALLGLGLWLPGFVHLWLDGRCDLANGKELSLLIGLVVCLRTYGNLLNLFWHATGRAVLTTTLAWTQAVLKVLVAIWLTHSYGIVGLFAASCVASLLQVLGMGSYLLGKGFLRSGFIVLTLLLTGGASAGAYFLGNLLTYPSLWALLGGIATTTVIWGSICLILAWFGEPRPMLAYRLDAVWGYFAKQRSPLQAPEERAPESSYANRNI